MVADTGQMTVNPDILSKGIKIALGKAQRNSALEVILAVKEDGGLAARIGPVPVNERIKISHESYVAQRDILMAYLAGKGIESKPMENCPWFVSASLAPQQIYELAAEQDAPVKEIVLGNGLANFHYELTG